MITGNRMHPTLKVQKFHNGVDFAAPSGTAILAAYSGNVVGRVLQQFDGQLCHDRPRRWIVYNLYARVEAICFNGTVRE